MSELPDISEDVFALLADSASYNGAALASGAVVRPGWEQGGRPARTAGLQPEQASQANAEFATAKVRKTELAQPAYQDTLTAGGKTWTVQNFEEGANVWLLLLSRSPRARRAP